jgi:hypothetical protein
MKYPRIPIVVMNATYSTHDTIDAFAVSSAIVTGKPFMAVCIANPQLRSAGETEEDAIKKLKELIKSNCGLYGKGFIKYATISFDDELVEEVMNE